MYNQWRSKRSVLGWGGGQFAAGNIFYSLFGNGQHWLRRATNSVPGSNRSSYVTVYNPNTFNSIVISYPAVYNPNTFNSTVNSYATV